MTPRRRSAAASHRRALATAIALLASCQSPAGELSGLAALPPLDYAALVTGGTFADDAAAAVAAGRPGSAELLPVAEILAVLQRGGVFRRVQLDDDEQHRRAILQQVTGGGNQQELVAFAQSARDRGFDLLLVVEQLQVGPIEARGINGRWPITLATWLMLGVGMFIPDHTFESPSKLRVTVRDLQTGQAICEQLVFAEPVDLSLVERSNLLGLLVSIVVPPFWVHDDQLVVAEGVRDFTERRLLVRLARDLKSESVRQQLHERAVAAIRLGPSRQLQIEARESISAVRLRPALSAAEADGFERALLGSLRQQDGRLYYGAPLPSTVAAGTLQVLVGTITGNVASATLQLEPQP